MITRSVIGLGQSIGFDTQRGTRGYSVLTTQTRSRTSLGRSRGSGESTNGIGTNCAKAVARSLSAMEPYAHTAVR
jgi:hypothetical protein